MQLIISYSLSLIILFSLCMVIFKCLSNWTIVDRLIASFFSVLFLALISSVVIEILSLPFDIWNNNRLTPAFALAYGYKFFNALESEPILSWMYGPIAAISYLPATLANSPTVAIRWAGLISTLFFFLPILCFSIGTVTQVKIIKHPCLSARIFITSFLLVTIIPLLAFTQMQHLWE
ncbi:MULTISPECIES: hypothetical protein [unclassified Coleofasciculus]|uniref:hypothetical protein n=1 Tax=unclassified Coleofasciculus TaxID=2692782 RepID=UPI00187E51BE|nr:MULTISPECIES: hypothetical protein [unclassified Coleofasciculus]MBE9125813.1 hypothetical protein [Coleofasciculus sp. LEGE 07081]MBE9149002.1 hypothetical protein [Coleofasciculus sp. LEGE 07092]